MSSPSKRVKSHVGTGLIILFLCGGGAQLFYDLLVPLALGFLVLLLLGGLHWWFVGRWRE